MRGTEPKTDSAKQPKRRRSRGVIFWLGCLLTLVACQPEGIFTFQSDQIRLLFSPFQGRSFGTSFQIPVLVVVEYTGKLSGKACLFLQISYADTSQLVLQPYKGRSFSSTDSDISDTVFKQYEACSKEKRGCLIGILEKRTPELIAQVELLTPDAGGLLIGGLFKGDCSAEDTFASSNILARESLAIGRGFQSNQESSAEADNESTTEGSAESAAESQEAVADGGGEP